MSKQFIKSKKRLSRYLAALVAIGSIPTVNVYAEEVNEIESPSTVIEENIHTEEEEIEGINELMQSDESSETTITSDESSETTITPEESQIICAILHDICKANFYNKTTRNKKDDERIKVQKTVFQTTGGV